MKRSSDDEGSAPCPKKAPCLYDSVSPALTPPPSPPPGAELELKEPLTTEGAESRESSPKVQRSAAPEPPVWDERWRKVNGQWRWTCTGPHDRRVLPGVLTHEECAELIGVWERNSFDLYEGSGKERKERQNFLRPKMSKEDRSAFARLTWKVVQAVGAAFGKELDLDQATLSSTNNVGHAQHADNELYFVRRKNPVVDVPLSERDPPEHGINWQTHPTQPDRAKISATDLEGVLQLHINDDPPVHFRSLKYRLEGNCVVCGDTVPVDEGAPAPPPEVAVPIFRGPSVQSFMSALRTLARRRGFPDSANLPEAVPLDGVLCPGVGGQPCGQAAQPWPAAVECHKCGLRYCEQCVLTHECEQMEQIEACRRGLAEVEWRTGPTAHRNFGCSVALCDPSEYEGGGVHFVRNFGDTEYCDSYYCNKGTAVAFCGCHRNIHTVEPVTKGRRLVLLFWTRPHGADPPQGAFGALPRPGTGPGVWLTMGDDGI
eukprot:TRINITY_DN60289_c0_g1_i1.p1 TRINITY_DN60289_c0_g1~~TRINITY_DN60289_c0_g1_i1.p1  ORF type:complete len:487 (+),score=156.45 TRINITY_DN60289_c0_g1_i1:97-1557(+)